MRYAAKYRIADGGVVDLWSGPDEVLVHDHRGHPVYEGEARRNLGELALDLLGVKRERRMKVKTTSPIAFLSAPGQATMEIDEATFKRLAPLTGLDGRLQWTIEGKEIVPVGGRPIYASEPTEPSTETIRGEMHVQIPGLKLDNVPRG
jgi:hypothetical protein